MSPAARAYAVAICALASLSGCARPTPENHASAVERAACRQRVNQVYVMQHRDEVYRADTYATSTRDAPFAAGGLTGVTSSGLSGRFAREQMVSDCLRSSADSVGATPAAPSPDDTSPR